LKSRGFFTESYWYWIGVGALVGYTLLFNFGYMLALTFLNRECLQLTYIIKQMRVATGHVLILQN